MLIILFSIKQKQVQHLKPGMFIHSKNMTHFRRPTESHAWVKARLWSCLKEYEFRARSSWRHCGMDLSEVYTVRNDQSAAASFERRRSSTSTSGDASNYRSFGSLINNTLASLAAYLLLGHVEKFGVGVVTERHACLAGLRAPAPPPPPPACRAYPLQSSARAPLVARSFIINLLIKIREI